MASTQNLQALLRFLSQDAKVPLATAMSKVKDLQAANMITPHELIKSNIETLQKIFGDEKVARQVLNAAKRISKKRTNSDLSTTSTSAIPPSPASKRTKLSPVVPIDPASFEASLALPTCELDEEHLKDMVVFTNRAPLVLAFAVTLLKYTMPSQPLSSRLSLAQAVCSANSQSKAKYLGMQRTPSASDEGWGEGQPLVTVLNREIRVMKRWGYTWKAESETQESVLPSSQDTVKGEDTQETAAPDEPALWGVDLEALKKSNTPVAMPSAAGHPVSNNLPIYRPEGPRAYLLKSFGTPPQPATEGKPAKPVSGKKAAEEKERNLGTLLGALDMLCQSWEGTLSSEDLDKRAWSWYCAVRPDVKAGAAGWGGKGDVKLADILKLRRQGSQ